MVTVTFLAQSFVTKKYSVRGCQQTLPVSTRSPAARPLWTALVGAAREKTLVIKRVQLRRPLSLAIL